MIRFARVFLWLRWKLFVGGLKEAASKGTISRFGTTANAIGWMLGAVFLVALGVGLSIAALNAARMLTGAEETERAMAMVGLRAALAGLLVTLLVMPAVRAGRGSFGKGSAGLTRLLLLPWSRRHLHSVEVFANAMDPFVLVTVPGLTVLAVAIAQTVTPISAMLVVLCVGLMIVTLMAWVAMLGIALQLLFRDRKRAEVASVIMLILVIGASLLPATSQMKNGAEKAVRPQISVVDGGNGPSGDSGPSASSQPSLKGMDPNDVGAEESLAASVGVSIGSGADSATPTEPDITERRARLALEFWAERFPVWLHWLPSESFSRALSFLSINRVAAALPSLLSLAGFAAACWFLSLQLWDRMIRSPGTTGSGRIVDLSNTRWRTLPGLSAQTSVVAFSTARGFLRTVRGKLAVVLTPIMVMFLGVMLKNGEAALASSGPFKAAFGNLSSGLISIAVLMSLLNVMPVLGNLFAVDQAGFTLQALTPIPERRIVWGKVAGCFLIFLVCVSPSVVLTEMWHRSGVLVVLEALLRGLGAFAVAAAVGVWMSTLFPKPVNLNSLSNEGNPHLVSQLAGMLAVALATLVGSLGGFVGVLVIGGKLGRLAGSSVVVLLLCLVAIPVLEAAARGLRLRWEEVAAAAGGHR